jgi:hypothetical protein
MTQAEWLACGDPVQLLAAVADSGSQRRLRLFACGCCRALELTPVAQAGARVVEVAERHADARATDDELRAAHEAAEEVEPTSMNERPWNYVCLLCYGHLYIAEPRAREAAGLLAEAALQTPESRVTACAVLRDIFANPSRAPTFSPSWRSDTAVALAAQMYEARDFSAMPILADALQDAGCDIAEILDHCRGPEPHVRGCWMVDLVLGKG